MNTECGGGDGFYRQVVAQKRGNAQAVKRGNFGRKEEMRKKRRMRGGELDIKAMPNVNAAVTAFVMIAFENLGGISAQGVIEFGRGIAF